ncbi:hypothetical protein R0K05_21875, partial [Planococcus sp. SIMBA_160]
VEQAVRGFAGACASQGDLFVETGNLLYRVINLSDLVCDLVIDIALHILQITIKRSELSA